MTLLPTSSLLVFLPTLAAAQVVTVDDGGGADFTDLQPAIDAVAAGGTVLVKDGVYADFTIAAKSVAVVADDGAVVEVLPSVVRDLAAGQVVVLRGLRFTRESAAGITLPLLALENNLGRVWIEEGLFDGTLADTVLTTAALRVVDSESVIAARTIFRGAHGSQFFVGPGPFDVNHGIVAKNSNLALHGCELTGGLGATGFFTDFDTGIPPHAGGHGVSLDGGTLFAGSCRFQGGDGGDGAHWPGGACWNGQSGGHGLFVTGGAQVHVLDSSLGGGSGGGATLAPCSAGASGTPSLVDNGSLTTLPGAAPAVATTSPVREGQSLAIDVTGQSGALAGVAFSFAPEHLLFLPWSGVVHLGGTPFVLAVAGVPPSGTVSFTTPIGDVLPIGGGASAYVQSVVSLPAGGFVLSGPSAVTILDTVFWAGQGPPRCVVGCGP